MKVWLLAALLLLLSPFASCAVTGKAGEIKTYADPGQAITASISQEFIIALDSNPTTGYSWQETHDENMLKLVEKKYQAAEKAKPGLVGAGGTDTFRFQALKKGETKIALDYKRPWAGGETGKQKVFTIKIK